MRRFGQRGQGGAPNFQFDKKIELHRIADTSWSAEVAQLVEHAAENRGVRSPILRLGISLVRKWLSW